MNATGDILGPMMETKEVENPEEKTELDAESRRILEMPLSEPLPTVDMWLVQLLMTLIQYNKFIQNRLDKTHDPRMLPKIGEPLYFLESIRDILQNIYDTDPVLATNNFSLPQKHGLYSSGQLIYNEHAYVDHRKWRDGKGMGLVFNGVITMESVKERFVFDGPSLNKQIEFVDFILDRHDIAATKIQNAQRQHKARKTKRKLARDRNTQIHGVYRGLIRQKMAPKLRETDLRVAGMGIPGSTNRVTDLFEQYQKYIPVEGGRKRSRGSKSRKSKSNRRKSNRRKSNRRKSNRRKSNRRKSRKK
jgi:hypothetical protein